MIKDLIVSYKYKLHMPIARKTIKTFLKDITDERHIRQFMKGNMLIWISPVYNEKYWQIVFDFDIKSLRDYIYIYNKLKSLKIMFDGVFGDNTFQIERTKTGFHFVSNLVYEYANKKETPDILSLKRYTVNEIWTNGGSLLNLIDVDTIYRDLPFKRIGVDEESRRIYYPILTDKYLTINNIDLYPVDLYPPAIWVKYIEKNLTPRKVINLSQYKYIMKKIEQSFL